MVEYITSQRLEILKGYSTGQFVISFPHQSNRGTCTTTLVFSKELNEENLEEEKKITTRKGALLASSTFVTWLNSLTSRYGQEPNICYSLLLGYGGK